MDRRNAGYPGEWRRCRRWLSAALSGCLLGLVAVPIHTRAATAIESAAARYATARELIRAGDFTAALDDLQTLRADYPDHVDRPAIDTRIAVLFETLGADPTVQPFIAALDRRDAGEVETAIAGLRDLIARFPASRLHDDALYLVAYLQLMDRYDFSAARSTLAMLVDRYPDSSYRDSADYLSAIALEQLGETAAARTVFERLRDRHTALSLPFGFRWPAGSVLSRYWYERADRRLAILDRQRAESTSFGALVKQADGSSRVTVSSGGVDLPLVLVPASLTRSTRWRDESAGQRPAPALGVYTGRVEGEASSWARVVIGNGSIRGVVHVHGNYYRLQPADLVGTLNYYQPRRMPVTAVDSEGRALADQLRSDTLMAPPAPDTDALNRARDLQTDIRRVPVSIVVDSQFDRYYAGNGLERALNSLNVADGIYREHGLALSLSLSQATVLQAEASGPDPFDLGPVPLETSLRRFREHRMAEAAAYANSALVYLFSGNPRTDVTLGLAWIGTACRTDGYDVGITTPSTLGDLLLTHELGHSFGALHDSDTSCRADAHRIMWPEVSSRTDTAFTACSEEAIVPVHERACLLNGVDLNLEVQITHDEFRFIVGHTDSALVTDATLAIETSVPGALAWPAACRPQTPGSASCQLQALGPGQRQVFSVPLGAAARDRQFAVSAYLDPALIDEVAPADNRSTLLFDGRNGFTDPEDLLQPTVNDAPLMSNAGGGSGAMHGVLLAVIGGLGLGRRLSAAWRRRRRHVRPA